MKTISLKISSASQTIWNESGAAAIEFAIVLPLLLFLFVGMVELTTALSYDRRVSKTGSSIADLVARSDDVSDDIDDISRAIAHQMAPFSDADVDVRLGMVLVVQQRPKIVWSWGNKKNVPWVQGSEPEGITFAPTMLVNGQTYVITTTSLNYNFILGNILSGLTKILTTESGKFTSMKLSDSSIQLPRRVSCVEYNGNCASYP